jgi:hypothetical protein
MRVSTREKKLIINSLKHEYDKEDMRKNYYKYSVIKYSYCKEDMRKD